MEVDTSVPHLSRVYDYLLGGIDNFAVDRAAAELASADVGGMDIARRHIRANRSFLGWSVRHLATEVGLRQFLDIGTGIPNADNVHAVARSVAPDARVVYVDNDPVVLVHSHELLRGSADGGPTYIDGDLRDPGRILERAGDTLDLDRPVAVMLVGVLHLVSDDDDAYGQVAGLMAPLAPGSHLVVSHLALDIEPEQMARLARRVGETLGWTLVLRTRAEVAHFLDGLDVAPPGVVAMDDWPAYEGRPVPAAGHRTPFYVGIGRKP